MLLIRSSLLVLATVGGRVTAQSLVNIDTFTDNRCRVASKTAANVTVPLDTCITTVGMLSFYLAITPCAGGSAQSVQKREFKDGGCSKKYSPVYDVDGECSGDSNYGVAFGSILLTCTADDIPVSPVSTTTINVGPVVTGAENSSPTGSSSGASFGSGSGSSDDCHGFKCLSTGAKVGIFVGGALGVILLSSYLVKRRQMYARRRIIPLAAPVYTPNPPVQVSESVTHYKEVYSRETRVGV